MKAIVYEKFGPPEVLRVTELPKPEINSRAILVNVKYTSVTAADVLMRKADSLISRIFLGILKPRRKVLGTEFSGIVGKIGKDVTKVKEGDEIFGFTGFKLGAYAEYCVLDEKASFIKVPAGVTLKDAVGLADGATTAVHFLVIKANLQPNDEVLIIGATGSIGTYALQIAKYRGARITGVCSTKNIDYAQRLGADQIIDYTHEDYHNGGQKFDIIFDCIGNSSFKKCNKLLKENGKYITTRGGLLGYIEMIILNKLRKKKVIAGMSIDKSKEMEFVYNIATEKKLETIIDREYKLSEIVEAHRHVEQGHKRGNVVISI